MSPAVSVIMPVYNASDTLAVAVASIQAQTLPELELVIVDDGSSDDSAEIAQELAKCDGRVRVLRIAHGGIVPALTVGIKASSAPLVARMDADDISHPTRLEQQVALLSSRPDVGLAGCRVAFGGDRDAQAGYAAYIDWTNSLVDPGDIALNRFVESPFAHPSVMFRRELCDLHGGYRDGPFPEDYELWLRWLDASVPMAKVPEELLIWNDPPGRLSRTDDRYSWDAFYRCKAEYLARWLARHNPRHPDVVVWGAGRLTRKRAELLTECGVRITHYIDIDPRKVGQRIADRPVWGEDDIPPPGACFVVSYVASRGARDDIRARLLSRGYTEGKDYLLAA